MDNPPASPEVLIPEARERQRRRYRRSAIVISLVVLLVVGLAALLIAVTSGGSETSHTPSRVLTSQAAVPAVLIRPALCYTPPYDSKVPRRSGSLPTGCPAPYTLTSQGGIAHLGFAAGPDPALAPYPSSTGDKANQVALIGSSRGPGERFLVGPATMRLSAATVTSVHTERNSGDWVVDIQLSAAGNAAWHAIPGSGYNNATVPLVIDMGGKNVNGPFFQPTFDSLRVIPNLTRSSAQALVAAIKR